MQRCEGIAAKFITLIKKKNFSKFVFDKPEHDSLLETPTALFGFLQTGPGIPLDVLRSGTCDELVTEACLIPCDNIVT